MKFLRLVRRSLLFGAIAATPLAAQQRHYLIEAGAGGAFSTFDSKTNLKSGPGGVARLGVWLLPNVSIEGEFGLYGPKSKLLARSWKARSYIGSALGNLPIGGSNSVFLRAGYGITTYGSGLCTGTPPRSAAGACGSSGTMIGGAGARIALAPTVMLRAEGFASHASSSGVTNLGASLGFSFMLGSSPLTDADRDGVPDRRDRCRNTPLGALVDAHGCPTDTDHDGVFDGLDRCPTTQAGVTVDAAGCPVDSDGDNVPDGIDACPNTPAGAVVDAKGCPIDSDGDGVPDGLDRCPATPAGASVDQLGCPGDEDGDHVLDGLDRCPRTPPGTTVNMFGCPLGVPSEEQEGAGGLTPGANRQLAGVQFAAGSTRLPASALPALDSLATELKARPDVSVEIAAYGDGTARETRTLTQLRADAVRQYLTSKGVPLQQTVATGYGNAAPLNTAATAAAHAQNRRIEIHVLPSR